MSSLNQAIQDRKQQRACLDAEIEHLMKAQAILDGAVDMDDAPDFGASSAGAGEGTVPVKAKRGRKPGSVAKTPKAPKATATGDKRPMRPRLTEDRLAEALREAGRAMSIDEICVTVDAGRPAVAKYLYDGNPRFDGNRQGRQVLWTVAPGAAGNGTGETETHEATADANGQLEPAGAAS